MASERERALGKRRVGHTMGSIAGTLIKKFVELTEEQLSGGDWTLDSFFFFYLVSWTSHFKNVVDDFYFHVMKMDRIV